MSRGLNGIGLAIATPAIQSLVADSTNRGAAFGWLLFTGSFGSILGNSVSLLTSIIGIAGWRLAFHLDRSPCERRRCCSSLPLRRRFPPPSHRRRSKQIIPPRNEGARRRGEARHKPPLIPSPSRPRRLRNVPLVVSVVHADVARAHRLLPRDDGHRLDSLQHCRSDRSLVWREDGGCSC